MAAGCATSHPKLVTDPVGPITASNARFSGHPQGTLMVYTATEDVDDGGIMYYPHTPYSITTPDGKLVKAVRNHVGDTDQSPMTVPLNEGEFFVNAQAEGKGWVTVPVVISRGRLTMVNLELRKLPEIESLPETERVRLPDGRIIGRRATLPAKETQPGQ